LGVGITRFYHTLGITSTMFHHDTYQSELLADPSIYRALQYIAEGRPLVPAYLPCEDLSVTATVGVEHVVPCAPDEVPPEDVILPIIQQLMIRDKDENHPTTKNIGTPDLNNQYAQQQQQQQQYASSSYHPNDKNDPLDNSSSRGVVSMIDELDMLTRIESIKPEPVPVLSAEEPIPKISRETSGNIHESSSRLLSANKKKMGYEDECFMYIPEYVNQENEWAMGTIISDRPSEKFLLLLGLGDLNNSDAEGFTSKFHKFFISRITGNSYDVLYCQNGYLCVTKASHLCTKYEITLYAPGESIVRPGAMIRRYEFISLTGCLICTPPPALVGVPLTPGLGVGSKRFCTCSNPMLPKLSQPVASWFDASGIYVSRLTDTTGKRIIYDCFGDVIYSDICLRRASSSRASREGLHLFKALLMSEMKPAPLNRALTNSLESIFVQEYNSTNGLDPYHDLEFLRQNEYDDMENDQTPTSFGGTRVVELHDESPHASFLSTTVLPMDNFALNRMGIVPELVLLNSNYPNGGMPSLTDHIGFKGDYFSAENITADSGVLYADSASSSGTHSASRSHGSSPEQTVPVDMKVDSLMNHNHQDSQKEIQPFVQPPSMQQSLSSSADVDDADANNADAKFKCHCGRAFRQRYNLTRHIKTVHENQREFHCEYCEASFKLKSHMLTHVKLIHLKEKLFACPVCDRKFGTVANMQRHHQETHEHVRQFKCDICGSSFSSKFNLSRHCANRHPVEA